MSLVEKPIVTTAANTNDKSPVRKVRIDDAAAFEEVQALLENDYPAVKVSAVDVDGDTILNADEGGMRVFWIYEGRGKVFLPKGYRTQEGGRGRLPDEYQPDPIDPTVADVLDRLEAGQASLSEGAAPHVKAILDRRQGNILTSDITVEFWNLEHVPRPWSNDVKVESALVSLFGLYRTTAWSTKQSDSYELFKAGDQLVAAGEDEIRVRGQFRCFSMEKTDQPNSHVSTTRRLRYLLDTAGGCSFDFDPYRRLPLTWYMDHPGQQGDGVNFVNSHVVNIPQELSSTHFHPWRSHTGGLPQTEMYLVLDPKLQGLEARGRTPSIILFPDLTDLTQYEQYELEPGDLVYIPPGVGHRGMDVFVNILTVPGFKPHNEFYIDQDIHDRVGEESPYNREGFSRKNYNRLEDML